MKYVCLFFSILLFSCDMENLNPASKINPQDDFSALQTSASLTVDTKVTTNAATTITTTSAVLSAKYQSEISDVTEKGICYGIKTGPTTLDKVYVGDKSKSSISTTALSLISGTKYYVRGYYKTKKGTFYGNEVSFNTTVDLSTLKNGLIGYYPFNGNANDVSGNNVNGIVYGPALGKNRFNISNSAYDFLNGGYIKTSQVIANVTNSFTISVWAKTNDLAPIRVQGVLNNPDGPPIVEASHGFTNWDNQSAGVGIIFGTNQIHIIEHTTMYVYYSVVYSGNFSGWNHIVLVYNNHLPKLYLNGTLVATGVVSPMALIRPSNGSEAYADYQECGFGKSFAPGAFNSTRQFHGMIDDYGIWNRVLTDNEINMLFKNDFIP